AAQGRGAVAALRAAQVDLHAGLQELVVGASQLHRRLQISRELRSVLVHEELLCPDAVVVLQADRVVVGVRDAGRGGSRSELVPAPRQQVLRP
ncbi:hypothetical protein B4Q13_17470, partial [Lacticaseibacillus rhamnosus]